MEFGKLSDIARVDFQLPDTPAFTKNLLQKSSPTSNLKVYTGCPIWAHKAWVGKIYPANAKSQDYLKYYCGQFNTIELNSTHYHVPDSDTVARWREQASEGFRFAPKFPQPIAHEKRLGQGAKALSDTFCEVISGLAPYLGISFIQLPPYFDRSFLPNLKSFLADFPKHIPIAFEFRHHDWFKQNYFEEAAALLASHQAATVITDVAGRRDVLHMHLSTPVLFLRFVGNELHASDYSRADAWVQRICEWQALGLQEVYFFAHEPDNTLAPELAAYFIKEMNRVCKLQLTPPQLHKYGTQGSLF